MGDVRSIRQFVTRKARMKVCPGCGGVGGAHKRLDCAWWLDETKRQLPSKATEVQK